MTTFTSSQLADENRYLNDELNRVETILNSTRAEKDELSIRYNALSDRVSVAAVDDDDCFHFPSLSLSLFLLLKNPWKKTANFFFSSFVNILLSHFNFFNLFIKGRVEKSFDTSLVISWRFRFLFRLFDVTLATKMKYLLF